MIFSGILAIFIPPIAGINRHHPCGWLLVFSGHHTFFVYAWQTRGAGGVILGLLLGCAYLVAGVYICCARSGQVLAHALALGDFICWASQSSNSRSPFVCGLFSPDGCS